MVAKRKVLQMKDGQILKDYNSITEASKAVNRAQSTLSCAIKRNIKCAGYQWQYLFVDIQNEFWCKHPIHNVDVSSVGRIKLLSGATTFGSKQQGYCNIMINSKSYRVSRLVAETYLENPEDKPTVDHINRIRDDNRIENLRWATHSEQMLNRNPYKHQKKRKSRKNI